MKSKRAEFFDNAVVSGPDQKAFEEKVYAEAQAKRWPRVAEGTGTFEGQVAIVTGAAGGQGEMEAKMIAQQGAKVYMADIEEEGLKRASRPPSRPTVGRPSRFRWTLPTRMPGGRW